MATKAKNVHSMNVIGGIAQLWFRDAIKDHQSCIKGFDLKPHAALCLAVMTTYGDVTGLHIKSRISRLDFSSFSADEASILAELGLLSLQECGFIKLDAAGQKEMENRDRRFWGLGNVHWRLTNEGAKVAAPMYSENLGNPSSFQKQAVKDMLAANKLAISKSREYIKANTFSDEVKAAVKKAKAALLKSRTKVSKALNPAGNAATSVKLAKPATKRVGAKAKKLTK